MHWPSVEEICLDLQLPAGVCMRQLALEDVPVAVALLAAWFPGLADAAQQEMLTADFYRDKVALAHGPQSTEARSFYVLMLASDAAPLGYLVVEYEPFSWVLRGRLSAVAPHVRRQGFGTVLLHAEEAIGRALGVNTTLECVAIDNRTQCAALERTGRVLCGLMPGSERRRMQSSVIRKIPEALYYKILVPAEQLQWPEPKALRPATAAMMKLLFDHGESLEPFVPPAGPPQDPIRALGLSVAGPQHQETWPDTDRIASQLKLAPGLTVRQLARGDLPMLLDRLPSWHPELEGSLHDCLLTSDFYEEFVAFAGEDQSTRRRPAHARVFFYNGEMVGFNYSTFEIQSSTLYAEYIAVDPRHRGLGIAFALLPFKARMACAMGVDTVLAWATLHHPYRQMAAERSGFRLIGISPAADDSVDASGIKRYMFEAVYALSLVPPAQVFCPPREAMSPRVAALADFVLGPR